MLLPISRHNHENYWWDIPHQDVLQKICSLCLLFLNGFNGFMGFQGAPQRPHRVILQIVDGIWPCMTSEAIDWLAGQLAAGLRWLLAGAGCWGGAYKAKKRDGVG